MHAFTVIVSGAEEKAPVGCDPQTTAIVIAAQKARAVAADNPDAIVIGADTAVWLDGEMLGKPADKEDAVAMLTSLGGRSHFVTTGVAVACGSRIFCGAETSTVTFLPWSKQDAQGYVDRCDPTDKAGAYGIQDFNNGQVRCEGDYDNVVGLPYNLTLRLIALAEETNDL